MSHGELFLLVLTASGLSAFTGALGAGVVSWLLSERRIKKLQRSVLDRIATKKPPTILK